MKKMICLIILLSLTILFSRENANIKKNTKKYSIVKIGPSGVGIVFYVTNSGCRPAAASTYSVESQIEAKQTPTITLPIETRTGMEQSFAFQKYPPDTEADIVFYNGEVLTMEPSQPQAQAIAILDDVILSVGSNTDIKKLIGLKTQVINLKGRTLVPGFIDSHSHWFGDNRHYGFSTSDEVTNYLLENGWTSISEMFVTPDRLETLKNLDNDGRLKVRVNAYMPINYREQRFGRTYEAYTPRQIISPRVCLAGVKFVSESYYGETLYFTQAELNKEVKLAHDAGWQVAIHTELVEGHTMVLKAFKYALAGKSNKIYRHRIEHVLGITDEQLKEIRKKDYIASIQFPLPANFPYQDPTFNDRMPEYKYPLLCRWRDLYDAGVLIAGGSDWPWQTNTTYHEIGAAPAGSPLRLIYKAATHTNTQDVITDAWMDGQYLPVKASLQALTINGAYATFEEDIKGSLAPGKWADIVMLSDNPITAAATDIKAVKDIKVLMTMIAGKVEYCAYRANNLCPNTTAVYDKGYSMPTQSTER